MLNNSQSKQKPTLSPQERLQEAALKEMEKQTKLQTASRLQQGQSPDEIIESLNQLAQKKVAQPGTITGVLPALVQMIQGNGFNPMAPKNGTLGLDGAIKLQGLMTDMGEAERRQTQSTRRAPGEIAKSSREQLLLAQEQAQMGNPQALNDLGYGQTPNADPAYDPAFRKEYVKQDMERTFQNRKELDTYTRSLAPVMKDLMKFQDIAEKLPDYKGGVVNQMIARGDAVMRVIAADPTAVRFNSAIDAGLGNFVKSGGDTGTLSNQDLDRVKGVIGKTNIPFLDKVQVYTDMLEKYMTQLDTRKELAKDPDFDKRFPLIKAGRERFEKNKAMLESNGRQQGGKNNKTQLTVSNLFEGLE